MPRPFVYHLDDFRTALSPSGFRLFALLDELSLLSHDAKHALAQLCASAMPSTVTHADVFLLVLTDGIERHFSHLPPFDRD